MIVIIDYNMGNLGSIANMCKKIGAPCLVSSRPEEVRQATKLILPGVGSFDNGIKNLTDLGLVEVLNSKVINQKTPILGICLGMQLMALRSEEGTLSGLSWVDADVVKFDSAALRVPHMGWNMINQKRECALYDDMYQKARFYFVHSYHVVFRQDENVATKTHYGLDFTSSFQKENIFGTQFHPEKSHKFGMKLLQNYCELVPDA